MLSMLDYPMSRNDKAAVWALATMLVLICLLAMHSLRRSPLSSSEAWRLNAVSVAGFENDKATPVVPRDHFRQVLAKHGIHAIYWNNSGSLDVSTTSIIVSRTDAAKATQILREDSQRQHYELYFDAPEGFDRQIEDNYVHATQSADSNARAALVAQAMATAAAAGRQNPPAQRR